MNKQFSWRRVGALILQEFYITKHSLETFFDIFFFPLMNVVLFGFISAYLAGSGTSLAAQYAMLGVLLWEVIVISQYCVTVSSMWSVWSHNLTNLFVAPISITEYMTAHIAASFFKTAAISWVFSLSAFLTFGFNILDVGAINLLLYYLNLSLFAWAVGIVLLGFIFRYGTRIQAIAWGLVFFFQPLTAAFFPLSTLPEWLQKVALVFPVTHVFESARAALAAPGIQWQAHAVSTAMNIVYFAVCWVVFKRLFRKSRQTGQFARNDT